MAKEKDDASPNRRADPLLLQAVDLVLPGRSDAKPKRKSRHVPIRAAFAPYKQVQWAVNECTVHEISAVRPADTHLSDERPPFLPPPPPTSTNKAALGTTDLIGECCALNSYDPPEFILELGKELQAVDGCDSTACREMGLAYGAEAARYLEGALRCL